MKVKEVEQIERDRRQLEQSVCVNWKGANCFVPANALHQKVMQAIKRKHPNLKRNDPCICGSKQKFKKCCGRVRNAEEIKELTERLLTNVEISGRKKESIGNSVNVSSGGANEHGSSE